MNTSIKLKYALYACLAAWAAQSIVLWLGRNSPTKIIAAEASERHKIMAVHQAAMRALEDEYAEKMHHATGTTVYDRIFNTQEQPIADLISLLADEALPQEWKSTVKIEEFVHFILLVYLPHSRSEPSIDNIVRSLQPVIEHSAWALSDIAIFDHKRKSILFFDEHMLSRIQKNETLSPDMLALAKSRGEAFTRFNSVTVEGKMDESHMILEMEITGPHGTVVIPALVDTGATMTMLSEKVIRQTGTDDLAKAPRRTFNTVNGEISCPIVMREINIGGVIKTIKVAVNQRDELSIMGMNFFEGMDYNIDSAQTAVHMWDK